MATLEAWEAGTPVQARLRDEYVAHLRARPDGLLRSCTPDHLTAGAIVLSPDLDAVLLNLHRRARRWFAFGGHHEPDDASLLATALREATEESGLPGLLLDPQPVHLDTHAVGFCHPGRTVRHLDVRYAALAPRDADHHVSEESLDVRWWPVTALPELEDEMVTLIALARSRLQSAEPSSLAPEE